MEKPVDRGLDWAGLPLIATVARLLCRELTLQNEYLRLENRILVRHEACVANLRMRRVRGRSGDAPTSPEANLAGGGQGGRSRLKPRGIRGAGVYPIDSERSPA